MKPSETIKNRAIKIYTEHQFASQNEGEITLTKSNKALQYEIEAILEYLDDMYKEIQKLKNKKPVYVPPTRYA